MLGTDFLAGASVSLMVRVLPLLDNSEMNSGRRARSDVTIRLWKCLVSERIVPIAQKSRAPLKRSLNGAPAGNLGWASPHRVLPFENREGWGSLSRYTGGKKLRMEHPQL